MQSRRLQELLFPLLNNEEEKVPYLSLAVSLDDEEQELTSMSSNPNNGRTVAVLRNIPLHEAREPVVSPVNSVFESIQASLEGKLQRELPDVYAAREAESLIENKIGVEHNRMINFGLGITFVGALATLANAAEAGDDPKSKEFIKISWYTIIGVLSALLLISLCTLRYTNRLFEKNRKNGDFSECWETFKGLSQEEAALIQIILDQIGLSYSIDSTVDALTARRISAELRRFQESHLASIDTQRVLDYNRNLRCTLFAATNESGLESIASENIHEIIRDYALIEDPADLDTQEVVTSRSSRAL